MTPTLSPSPRTYHVHRARQRRRILDAAEELFDKNGIDQVTMAEIIAASGLRASTMYQYFSNKDDIVWAILEEVLANLAERAKAATANAKTALDRITALLDLMADDLTRIRQKYDFLPNSTRCMRGTGPSSACSRSKRRSVLKDSSNSLR